MNLTKFDPMRDLEVLSSRLNRVFGMPMMPLTTEEGMPFGDFMPAMDVEETDQEYLITADLPAIPREQVKVGIIDGVLSIEGERKQDKEEKNRKFHKVERSYGRFVRRLSVPTDVDQGKVAAEVKDGLLKVHLPKSALAKPRTVDIKVA